MVTGKEITLREKIIDSSRTLLLEDGYRNFSMRKVARSVGVSATSIYLYFDSKDHLIHTLIDESIQKLNKKLSDTAAGIDDPFQRIKVLANSYTDFALNYPGEYQVIYFVSSDEMSRYPKEKFRKAREGYNIVIEAIKEGIAKGKIAEEQPEIASYVFWAQLHGIISVVLTKRLDKRIEQEKFVCHGIEKVLEGFSNKNVVAR